MNIQLRQVLMLGSVLSASMFLPSCATPGASSATQTRTLGETQYEAREAIRESGGTEQDVQKFQADQHKTVRQGTTAGSVVGLAAGAALARQVPGGALIGLVAGRIIGNQVGKGVAKTKAGAEIVDSSYDGAIKNAVAANQIAQKNVASLRGQLADLKRRANRARSKGDAGEILKVKNDILALDQKYQQQEQSLDTGIATNQKLASQITPSNKQYADVTSAVKSGQQSRAQVEADRKEIASLLNSL
jgi:uncharacterized protein YcfJ